VDSRAADLRWTFLLVAAAICFALLVPVPLPIEPNKAVRAVYEHVEQLPPGSAVLLALDFDPEAKAELEPMTKALLRHCMKRNLRVIAMTFWFRGTAFHKGIFDWLAEQFPDKVNGRDFVYLGYQPGGMAQVITGMASNITATFPQDYDNRPTASLPIFEKVRSLKDVAYLVDLAAGFTPSGWILYASDKYRIPLAVGCTAVAGPDMYVRLDAGQINGLIAGLRGAADYEALLKAPGFGIAGMFAQSIVHGMIVLLVVIGNIAFFRGRRRRTAGERNA